MNADTATECRGYTEFKSILMLTLNACRPCEIKKPVALSNTRVWKNETKPDLLDHVGLDDRLRLDRHILRTRFHTFELLHVLYYAMQQRPEAYTLETFDDVVVGVVAKYLN